MQYPCPGTPPNITPPPANDCSTSGATVDCNSYYCATADKQGIWSGRLYAQGTALLGAATTDWERAVAQGMISQGPGEDDALYNGAVYCDSADFVQLQNDLVYNTRFLTVQVPVDPSAIAPSVDPVKAAGLVEKILEDSKPSITRTTEQQHLCRPVDASWRVCVNIHLAATLLYVDFQRILDVTPFPRPTKYVKVALTPSGPSPSTVKVAVDGSLDFVNDDSVAHMVVFKDRHCRFDVAPGDSFKIGWRDHFCPSTSFMGRHVYAVDGSFPGTIEVVGLRRSVTLTARTHTIRVGSKLLLHGQLKYDNEGAPFCAGTVTLRVFARHVSSELYRRVAMLSVGPSKKNQRATQAGCTYVWQLVVRPGTATTYVAKLTETSRIWRKASSRPFAVSIRPR